MLHALDIQRVSTAADGTQGNGDSFVWGISADGSKVVFGSSADNLVTDDPNGHQTDIFQKDILTGNIIRIPVDPELFAGGGLDEFHNTSYDGPITVSPAGGVSAD